MNLAILIPLFPLIGFLLNGFFGKKMSKTLSGTIGASAVFASFVVSIIVFAQLQTAPGNSMTVNVFDWISADTLNIPIAFLIDSLSVVFLLIITGIGFLIHVYSIGYMKHDEGFSRFFAYLNLFIFFMLLLVMGNNYLVMFMGWEGVGLCSYLLIGFWFKERENNNAARKAFVMNRIGDLGFLLGIFLIFVTYGSTTFGEIFPMVDGASESTITIIALLLFVGAMGKSAQIPLFTWLPDAMAGPTPVSALIHAATMVTAGVYMVVRSNVFYSLSQTASTTIAIVGVITMLVGALIALFQNDIKKILAYSTVSQLGLMFVALGVHAYSSAVFHVTTHAFFKALLFLAAGSVIHAMSGEQDIRKMGGLKGKIKITFLTMLIGTIAISGFPPFSGFFSKDEIFAHLFQSNYTLWLIALFASMLTTFYMFRLLYLTFFGTFRGTAAQEKHLHESPKSMTIPLLVLAILSIFGGVLGLPASWHLPNWMHHNLEAIVIFDEPIILSHATEWLLMAIAIGGAVVALVFSYVIYRKQGILPAEKESMLKNWQKPIFYKFYVDEVYETVIRKPLDGLAKVFYKVIDLQIINAIVDGAGKGINRLGVSARLLQNGNVGTYFVFMVAAIIGILLFTFLN